MKTTIRLLSLIALIISIIWFWALPGFEPALSIVVSLTGLITSFFIGNDSVKKNKQTQKIANNSSGIQAGESVNISIESKGKD